VPPKSPLVLRTRVRLRGKGLGPAAFFLSSPGGHISHFAKLRMNPWGRGEILASRLLKNNNLHKIRKIDKKFTQKRHFYKGMKAETSSFYQGIFCSFGLAYLFLSPQTASNTIHSSLPPQSAKCTPPDLASPRPAPRQPGQSRIGGPAWRVRSLGRYLPRTAAFAGMPSPPPHSAKMFPKSSTKSSKSSRGNTLAQSSNSPLPWRERPANRQVGRVRGCPYRRRPVCIPTLSPPRERPAWLLPRPAESPLYCHSRASGNPEGISEFPLAQQGHRSRHKAAWIPAYGGMTHRPPSFG